MLTTTVVLGLGAGCGGSGQTVRWQDSMEDLFSGSPGNPTSHPRHLWSAQDEDRLLRQMGYADAAALGTIRVLTQCDRYGKQLVAVEFQVREVLHGTLAGALEQGQKLNLRLDSRSPALRSTVQTARKIPGTQFLVFFKQRPDSNGKLRLFHDFYRPSPRLLAEVKSIYGRL